jgi:cob(I)alamin adenosyltransferase
LSTRASTNIRSDRRFTYWRHTGRTVCRRAERALVHLAATEAVGDPARRYLNRLSDLFFVLARVLNRTAGRTDVLWEKHRRAEPG